MNNSIKLQIKLGLNPYEKKTLTELKALPKEIKDEFKRHWDLTEDYAKDLRTGIKWYKAIDEKKYTYDEAIAKYGDKLPTKEEFEQAEKHGIRMVLEDFENRWYWSSSVYSLNRNLSWNFYGANGYVLISLRNSLYWARCVSRPTD